MNSTRPAHRPWLARVLVAILSATILLPNTVLATSGPAAASPASPSAGDRSLYIVVQSTPPLALYQGGVAGLAATNPEARGEVKLNPTSAASQAYLNYLHTDRATLVNAINAALGRSITVGRTYDFALNGFTTNLTAPEADIVRGVPGVYTVAQNEMLHTLTDAGPEWIGADSIWDGSAIAGVGSKGERIVAGIIDTGINAAHPSFAGVGPVDGYVFQNPRGRFYGICAATPPPAPGSLCNDKLIGYYDYTSAGFIDDEGHGSHTASTVAGNLVDATLVAPTTTLGPTRISGVAPHANIIAYKACSAVEVPVLGSCPLDALVAAIDQATADVVDVVNFSIGGGSTNPWTDPMSLAFFGTHAAGIFVAASAGNDGPNASTMGHPANAPWLLGVAASTHNRRPTVSLDATRSNGAGLHLEGMAVTSGVGPAPLISSRDIGNDLCDPFTAEQAAQVAGKIVVCEQGVIARVAKGQNVKDAGGVGMVLIAQAGYKASSIPDTHFLPAVMLSEYDGQTLRTWLAGATGASATLSDVEMQTGDELGDRMAGFSSRGPDASVPDVIKPDITAPGVAIWAAWLDDGDSANGADYNIIQGTSMSSPHAAGAGALLRSIHPDWTPDQIKSALMSTSFTAPDGGREVHAILKEDYTSAADPFDRGAGRIDLRAAARAGFTVADSVAGYLSANPALGGAPSAINLPSLASSTCATTCTWTRTLVSTSTRSITYDVSATAAAGFTLSVSPAHFTLDPISGPSVAPGLGSVSLPGTQVITITAINTGLPANRYQFGELTFTANAPSLPPQHFPVAVADLGGPAPSPDCTIPETVVTSSAAVTNVPDYNDIREIRMAGLYPTYGGTPLPNLRVVATVESLGVAGALPPNQHWRIAFVPPGAPSGTSYFVAMATDTTSTPTFSYGTLAGGSFTTAGAPDSGSYDLATNSISWVIAAGKFLSPTVGSQLTGIVATSGAAVPGTLTTNLKTTPASTYTLTDCGGGTATPTPTASATPTPTPSSSSEPGSELTLYFQGNLDEGCTGDGQADFATCGGPFLLPKSELDPLSAPAHWETTSAQDDGVDRGFFDPNWIWELSEPTTIGGPMTVEWWGQCNICAGDAIDPSMWNIRIWADGVQKFAQEGIEIPIETPGVPVRLSTTVTLPNISANESIVLQVDPDWIDQQDPNVILYDAEQGCGIDGLSACDSLVRVNVGGVQATPTPSTSPTPTPTPYDCGVGQTADHVYFLGVVNDGNEPGTPRTDFQADMHNFEYFLSKLRESYCIPDSQTRILAFTDSWTDPTTGAPMSPYPEASEANVKAAIAELGAAANAYPDSTFFFFLSSHGIQYGTDGGAGVLSECPATRLVGSLSGLKSGGGETGDFFDCELGDALNASFSPTTRMFVAVDCSFCGGFSDSITPVSGTVSDGSAPTSAGVVGTNRVVMTGCSEVTECFGDSNSERGAVSYGHMVDVLQGEHSCDGWTAPAFPDVQGFDIPEQTGPTDGKCSSSEWFFAAVDSAMKASLNDPDPIPVQQQFRIKYGLGSIDNDIVIAGAAAEPTPTPTPDPTPTPAPSGSPSSEVVGVPMEVVDAHPTVRSFTDNTTDFGLGYARPGTTTWRVVSGTGNCCENHTDTSPTGRLFDIAADFIYYSDDRGLTWKSVQPPDPLLGAEGSMAVAPNGDILGMTWDPYTGDRFDAYKYNAATGEWLTLYNRLHLPFYDRPWLTVVPGDFTDPLGNAVPYVVMVSGGPAMKDPMSLSYDGLLYSEMTSTTLGELNPPVTSLYPIHADSSFDWIQSIRSAPVTALGNGYAIAEGGYLFDPNTMEWSPWTLPGGAPAPTYIQIDSGGRIHNIRDHGDGTLEYRISTDNGATWTSTSFAYPFAPDGPNQTDFKVNLAAGVSAAVIHNNKQDWLYKFDITGNTPKLIRVYNVGKGDVDAGSDVSSVDAPRFDFQTVSIFPDGRVAMAFLDSTTGGSPAMAVELDTTVEDIAPPTQTPTPSPTPSASPIACPITSWSDSFEPAANAGWTVDTAANGEADMDGGVTSPTWQLLNDPQAHSLSHSFWTNDAAKGPKDDRLIAPLQLISPTTQLTFWHRYQTEESFDGGVLEVSTNGGQTWLDVNVRGSFVSGGYNGVLQDGRAAWTGGLPGDAMTQVTAALGGFVPAGQPGVNALVRFRLLSDPLQGGEGWFVDDVSFSNVYDCAGGPTPTATPTPTPTPSPSATPTPFPTALPGSIGLPANSVPVTKETSVQTHPVTDFTGARPVNGTTQWRVVKDTGNCCELHLGLSKDGQTLFDIGGSFVNLTTDRGLTWTSIQPPEPLINGEGSIAVAPNGDVLGITWDAYTGDHLVAYKYVAETGQWLTLTNVLHQPFDDRPWISVVPGPVTDVAGNVVPYIAIAQGGGVLDDPMFISTDGLTYAEPSSLLMGDLNSDSVESWFPVTANPAADYDQPIRASNVTPLGNGYAAHSAGYLFDPQTREWHPWTLPGGGAAPTFIQVDSLGRIHQLNPGGSALTYRISTDGGQTWTSATFPISLAAPEDRLIDFKVNRAVGIAAVAARVNAQDWVYKFDITGDTARLMRVYRVGLGDNPAGSDIGALTSPRMDFQNVIIFPDGRVATSFLDSTTLSHPPGTGMLGRITPALAIELETDLPSLTDLQITNMDAYVAPRTDAHGKIKDGSLRKGDPIVLEATISNTGEDDAAASQTQFTINGDVVGTADTPAIAAGGSTVVHIDWYPPAHAKGTFVAGATANYDSSIEETDYANNGAEYTFEIKGNKVKNGDFEQTNSSGTAPADWQAQPTSAGQTGYDKGSSSQPAGVTINGTGGNAVLAGVPSWTSAAIDVTPGQQLSLDVEFRATGLSSAPNIAIAYLGTAGAVLNQVELLSLPVQTSGLATVTKLFEVPAGVSQLRIVLTGFSPTDVHTAGSIKFSYVGLYDW